MVCVDAGVGPVEVTVDGPSSGQTVDASVTQQADDLWLVEYTPLVAGPHTVNVYFAGQPVNHSPFTTHVKPRQSFSHAVSLSVCSTFYTYTLCLKKVPTFKLSVTLSNLNRFSKFLHC